MRLAEIKDGVVVNVTVGDAPHGDLIDAQGAGVGWSYDGAAFTAPVKPTKVPETVPAFKLRQALREARKLDEVNKAVAGTNNLLIQDAWESASEFARNSKTIAALAPSLNLSDADLDDLFVSADSIEM